MRMPRYGTAALCLAAAAAVGCGPQHAAARTPYAATIVRTTYGIPHIEARDHAGLGYGAGYTAAEDNVCIVADEVVTVRGQRSATFGATEKAVVGFAPLENLESDFFHKSIEDLAATRAGFAKTSPAFRATAAGFVAGYNRWLRDHAGQLPAPCAGAAWVRPLTTDDMLLLLQAGVQTGTTGFARQIAAAAPPSAKKAADASGLGLPAAEDTSGIGSNGWAFGGDFTADGRGMLVGNPHFPWAGGNRFRQMHLTIPGRFDVMGAGLVSSALVQIGFNRSVAWTHTVTTAVHHTLFELRLDPSDPTAYLVDGKREKMRARTIRVDVKGGEPVTRTLYATRYGPVVAMPQAGLAWDNARAYALRDANRGNLRSGDAWLAIARAQNVRQIRQIVGRTLGLPYVNTIAADRGGEALYADATPVPFLDAKKLADCGTAAAAVAAATRSRLVVLDGSRAGCDWTVDPSTPVAGLTPQANLPTAFRRDYVQNSNDSYWLSNAAAPLQQASPMFGGFQTAPSLRTQSGLIEIAKLRQVPGGYLTADNVKAAVLANNSLAADRMVDPVLSLCPQRPALADACAALGGWNRKADLDSTGALLFFEFVRRTSAIEGLWQVPFDPNDPIGTPSGLNIAEPVAGKLLDALAASADEMAKYKVPLGAPLGAVQVAVRGDQRIPIHGGPHQAGVLNVMFSAPSPAGMVPVHGTSYVQVVGFDTEGPVADAILAYSQSVDPASPHSADQTVNYSQKRWNRLPFTPAQIAAQALGPAVRISE